MSTRFSYKENEAFQKVCDQLIVENGSQLILSHSLRNEFKERNGLLDFRPLPGIEIKVTDEDPAKPGMTAINISRHHPSPIHAEI